MKLYKAASYLAGFGLVGVRLHDASDNAADGQVPIVWFYWLTSAGENYVRDIEAQPSVARRLTLASLGTAKEIVIKAAGTVLGELLHQGMR